MPCPLRIEDTHHRTNATRRLRASGSLGQAAELFCASARNCRIRRAASRHRSPAALLDERTPVPGRGNLVECDELCRGIGLLLEPFDADRSQRRDDRSFSALGGHLLGSAAECPAERRKPDDRERNGSDRRAPHRRFYPRMDLHLVTVVGRKGPSPVSDQPGNVAGCEPAKIGSETTQAPPHECRMSVTGPAGFNARDHARTTRSTGASVPSTRQARRLSRGAFGRYP